MGIETATTSGLDKLYHYQEFSFERLFDILINRKLYFSRPADFNDPWDGRPIWNISLTTDQEIENYLEYWRIGANLSGHEFEQQAHYFRENPDSFRDILERQRDKNILTYSNAYRVYCLSETKENDLMWAHYADKHRGVCLEFSVKSPFVCGAFKIDYPSILPVTEWLDGTAERVMAPIISKSKCWESESEYRLISQEKESIGENNISSENLIVSDKGKVDLQPNALTGIIVGCKSPASTLVAIESLVKKSGLKIKMETVSQEPNIYQLSFQEISIE